MRKGYEYLLSNFFYRVFFLFSEAAHFAFFPFYTSTETDRSYSSHIILNVTVKNETEWTLKNGLGAEMVKANTSTYKGLIVYPTYGYYLSSNFDHSLDVSITTYVETNTSEYSSFYRVQPRPMLGQNYTISMVSDSSSEYECAILAPIDQQLHIIVTLPPDLLYKVLLYDETLKETQTNYTVPKGKAVKLQSRFPINGVIIMSETAKFSVFCAERNMRYQLLPNRYCGKKFNALCPNNNYFSYCNVSLTSVIDNTILFRTNSTGQRSQMLYKGHFISFRLDPGMDMALRTTNEVCVLISKFRDLFVNNTILKSHVEMIFSQDNPPKKPSALTTTQKLEPTKVSTLMNKNSQTITTAGALHSFPLQFSSTLYSRVLSNRKTSIFNVYKTSQQNNFSQSTGKQLIFKTIPDSTKEKKSTSLDRTTNFAHIFLKSSPLTNQATVLSSLYPLTTTKKLKLLNSTSSKSSLQTKENQISTTSSVIVPISKLLMQGNTISMKEGCVCSYTEYCAEFRQDIVSQAEVTSKLNHLRSTLSVNKSSLTSFVRQKTCAVDERTSARNIGYVGVLVILMCSMLIISCDLITLFQLVRKV